MYGRLAVLGGSLFLVFLLGTTFLNGYSALQQTYIALDDSEAVARYTNLQVEVSIEP